MTFFRRLIASAACALGLLSAAAAQDVTSPNLQLLLMATGLHANDWGFHTNVNLTKIENSITATTSVTVSGGASTLTADQSRSLSLVFDGVLSSNAVVTVPATPKFWIVKNGTSGAFTLSLKTPTGTALVIPQSSAIVHIYWSDGLTITDVSSDSAITLTSGTVFANIGAGPAAVPLASFATALGLGTTSTPTLGGVIINAAPGNDRSVFFRSNNVNRWAVQADGAPESGSAAGSDFCLRAYNDAGTAYAGCRLKVVRSNGEVQIGGDIVGGKIFSDSYQLSPVPDGFFKNLSLVVNTSVQVNVTADAFTAWDGVNSKTFRNINVNARTNCAGAINCMDTGGPGATRWLQVWVVGNPTTGDVGAVITQKTPNLPPSPLPTGYTMYARAGAIRVDSSSILFRTRQDGRDATYVITPATNTATYALIEGGAQGTSGAGGMISVTVQGVTIPLTAVNLKWQLTVLSGFGMAGPSNNFGAYNSLTPPPAVIYQPTNPRSITGAFQLVGSTVFYAGDNLAAFYATGWTDNIND